MSDTDKAPLARGQGASPGQATGKMVFSPDEVVRLAAAGESVIFVRVETDSEDMPALRVAAGIVTTRGGLTSDAAIVARSLGKPCIAGCSTLVVSYADETLSVRGGVTLKKHHVLSIDGSRGLIYAD